MFMCDRLHYRCEGFFLVYCIVVDLRLSYKGVAVCIGVAMQCGNPDWKGL